MSDLLHRTEDDRLDMSQFPDEDVSPLQRRRLRRRLQSLSYEPVVDARPERLRESREGRLTGVLIAVAAACLPVFGLGALVASMTTDERDSFAYLRLSTDARSEDEQPSDNAVGVEDEAWPALVDDSERGADRVAPSSPSGGSVGIVRSPNGPAPDASTGDVLDGSVWLLDPLVAQDPPHHVDDCRFVAVTAGRRPVC